MSFSLDKNKGRTGTGNPLFKFSDSANKTYLGAFGRDNGVMTFRYYLKSDILAKTPVNGVYQGVSVGGLFTNDLTVDAAVVNGLTGTGHPDGVELPFQSGLVSTYFPEITNLNWIPVAGAVDTITVATINADMGNPIGKTKAVETVTANPDGTITVTGIKVGDKISVDGGTPVAATETTYTTPKLKDGSHTVIVTAPATATYYYDAAGKTVTTKIEFLSAPTDFISENPILSGAILLGFILLIIYVFIPLAKGEPIFNGMFEGGSAKVKSISRPKRRFIQA